ncbi:MAG: SDR family oxidoreductase [Spirochaetia bacterium]|nr:SDR family oxidoreductase [Spirochaetia bacterium]
MNNQKGKTALITGANRGLGRAMAEKLASMGAGVIITARNMNKGSQALKELREKGYNVTLYTADMEKPSEVERLCRLVTKNHPVIDILINNAGIKIEDDSVTIETINEKKLRDTMEVNFFSVVSMCRHMIPLLKKSDDARIVNISSGLSELTIPRKGPSPSYSMSKTAVNAITKNLTNELKNTNIMVFSTDPGWVRTDMSGPAAPASIEDGIITPIWLATAPKEELVNGGFYREKKIIPW